MPQPDWLGKTATHGYDHNAIDPARGIFYYRPFSSRSVYRYDIAADKWTDLPKLDTGEYLACCVGLAWFPELDGLVWANGGGGRATSSSSARRHRSGPCWPRIWRWAPTTTLLSTARSTRW